MKKYLLFLLPFILSIQAISQVHKHVTKSGASTRMERKVKGKNYQFIKNHTSYLLNGVPLTRVPLNQIKSKASENIYIVQQELDSLSISLNKGKRRSFLNIDINLTKIVEKDRSWVVDTYLKEYNYYLSLDQEIKIQENLRKSLQETYTTNLDE